MEALDTGEREYLRVLLNQLRKKIEDDPARPSYILTRKLYWLSLSRGLEQLANSPLLSQ